MKKRGKLAIRQIPLPPILARLILVHDIDHSRPDTRLWQWSRGRAWYLLKGIMHEACMKHALSALCMRRMSSQASRRRVVVSGSANSVPQLRPSRQALKIRSKMTFAQSGEQVRKQRPVRQSDAADA